MSKAGSTGSRDHWGIILLVILFILAVGCGLAAHNWKGDLRIARVSIEGNKIVTEASILSMAAIPKGARLYGVDIRSARQRVLQNPFIRSATVTREAPDGIVISVVERMPIAALALGKTLAIDSEGVVLPSVMMTGVFDLPVLTGDLPVAECNPGHRIQSRAVQEALDILVSARQVSEDLHRLISEVHIDGENDIVMYTSEAGVPVIFGRGNVPQKLLELDGFWKQIVLPRSASDLASVDLRFADQVVVRWNHDDTGVQ
jgi:cell division protein FtsQ